MGRQLAVAMELEDEEVFLSFLCKSTDIAIYRSWSPLPEAVPSFVPDASASQFWIHNRAFPWEPTFEQVNFENKSTREAGVYFRLNTQHAPLIEYCRHPMSASAPQVSGRLYWEKLFLSHSDQIAYDLNAYDLWFTSVVNWVRKHSKKVRHGATDPWCLPAARLSLQNAI